MVRLGDVAEVRGATDVETQQLAAVPLMPAPAAGTRQFLHACEVRDLLAACGVDVGTVQIRGAASVAISSPAVDAVSSPASSVAGKPAGRAGSRRTAKRRPDHAAAAIVAYLRQQTGHDCGTSA